MLKSLNDLKEGELMNGIMYRRIFKENKNFIQVKVGPTGSGKSYNDLREAEIWYRDILKKEFPIENMCFSPEAIFERLEFFNKFSPKEIKGEILIYEEAGTSAGSLDFQNSIVKMFNYLLQSFRSMNMILFLNLPYFSMLNKQSRTLAHFLMTSQGIDKTNKQSLFKMYWLHTDQKTGKPYTYFPMLLVNGYYEKIEIVGYNLPSERLRNLYEAKKNMFLKGLISGSLESIRNKNLKKLTPIQMQIWGLIQQNITNQTEIAKRLGVNNSNICQHIQRIRRKGYNV